MTPESVVALLPSTPEQQQAFWEKVSLDKYRAELLHLKESVAAIYKIRNFIFDVKKFTISDVSIDPILHKKYLNFKSGYTSISFTGNRIEASELYAELIKDERDMKVIGMHEKDIVPDKDLLGQKVAREIFRASDAKNDDGFMIASAGLSAIDGHGWVVTTHHIHADEVPNECTDAKTTCELVAKLLNQYYSK